MKKIIFILTTLLVASSCRPAVPTESPSSEPFFRETETATFLPAPTSTFTLQPTPTRTPTPTLTLVPRIPITAENAGDLQLLRQINGLISADVAWSPDGTLLALASDRGIILFDSLTLMEVSVIPNDYSQLFPSMPHIMFSLDGKQILIAGLKDWKGGGQIFDVGSGDEISTFTSFEEVIRFCPSGKTLVGRPDFKAYCVAPEKSRFVGGDTVAFSPDEDYLGAGNWLLQVYRLDDEGTLESLWNSTYNWPWGDYILSADFSPDGKILAAGFGGGDIHFYDPESGREIYSLVAATYISGLAFSPDGTRLAYASPSGSGVIDLEARYELTELGGNSPGPLSDLAFSPDGHWLATSNQADNLMLWERDAYTLAHDWTMRAKPAYDKPGWLTCLPWASHFAYSPDGKRIALTRNGTLQMIEVDTLEILYLRQIDEATSIAFSPDGRYLATGTGLTSSGEDTLADMPAVQTYDAGTGNQLHTFGGLSRGTWPGFPPDWNLNCVIDLAFTPDSRYLAVADMSSIKFWDMQSGERAWEYFDAKMNIFMDIEFSRDGSMFAAVDYGGKARLWRIEDREIARYPDRDWNNVELGHIAFSPDGSLISFVYRRRPALMLDIWATGSSDKVLSLEIASYTSYPESAGNQVVFSEDGGLLAIASRGGIPGVVSIYGLKK